ncbi:hypothetical protein CW362_39285 [Streptomyces populi]|uniref:Uncharacterized protein n=1 Tax=Streptomyces populi TaxID=2058924 RepID=A0A2I0SCK1_9ACTN|nr:hypothetical protein [Streptomyces populi]PKT67655.1 hypothetical protein CW362_39285 [Streptomyces populi]
MEDQGGTLGKEARDAQKERARNAPGGEPVSGRTDLPEPEDYGFGDAVETASGGEVVAYEPREQAGRLVVPLTVHNGGDERTAYTVVITARSGKTSRPVVVKAPNVFAGTTWPTEADMTADGLDDPADVDIALKVTKDVYPFGDGR